MAMIVWEVIIGLFILNPTIPHPGMGSPTLSALRRWPNSSCREVARQGGARLVHWFVPFLLAIVAILPPTRVSWWNDERMSMFPMWIMQRLESPGPRGRQGGRRPEPLRLYVA